MNASEGRSAERADPTCCLLALVLAGALRAVLLVAMSGSGARLRAPEPYPRAISPSSGRPHLPRRGAWMPHLKNRVLRGFRPIAIICIVFTAVFSVHRAFFSLATYKTHRKISLTEPTRSPTRYRGGVPIVDREKLAEVEDRMAYYAHLDGGDPNFREWVLPPNPYSPPKVTAIPEPPRKSKTHALELWPDEKADMQLCHEKTGCRLLLPTW